MEEAVKELTEKLSFDMSQFTLVAQLYIKGQATYCGLNWMVLHCILSSFSLFVHLPKAGQSFFMVMLVILVLIISTSNSQCQGYHHCFITLGTVQTSAYQFSLFITFIAVTDRMDFFLTMCYYKCPGIFSISFI